MKTVTLHDLKAKILNNTFLRKFEIQDGCHAIFLQKWLLSKMNKSWDK